MFGRSTLIVFYWSNFPRDSTKKIVLGCSSDAQVLAVQKRIKGAISLAPAIQCSLLFTLANGAMLVWALRLCVTPRELWWSILRDEWQDLVAVCVISVVSFLWLQRLRGRWRRVADRQSRTEARQSTQRVLSAQSGGAQAPPAAAGQTREQARKAGQRAHAAGQEHSQARPRSAASTPSGPAAARPRGSPQAPTSSKPIKTQRLHISSGSRFYTHIVQMQIKHWQKERPEPRPAAATGLQTPTRIKDLRQVQNAIGLSRVSEAETKKTSPHTVVKRRSSESSGRAKPPAASGQRSGSAGDLRLRHLILRNLVAQGDIEGPGIPLPQRADRSSSA